jgi:hypothetical protein
VIANREKKATKIERSINNAKVKICVPSEHLLVNRRNQSNWKPALERLVESIGQKFSAAFDRE